MIGFTDDDYLEAEQENQKQAATHREVVLKSLNIEEVNPNVPAPKVSPRASGRNRRVGELEVNASANVSNPNPTPLSPSNRPPLPPSNSYKKADFLTLPQLKALGSRPTSTKVDQNDGREGKDGPGNERMSDSSKFHEIEFERDSRGN